MKTDFQDLLIALNLLPLNKRQINALLLLFTYYLYSKEGSSEKVSLKDISLQIGLDSTVGSLTLDSLIDYNILGSVVLKEFVVKKEIAQHFQRDFLQTLRGKKNLVKQAIDRVGFFVKEGTKIYIFNPVLESWKYDSWYKLRKALKILGNRFPANEFLKNLSTTLEKSSKNTRKKVTDKEGRINAPYLVGVFLSKFNSAYGKKYTPNWAMDSIKMNNLIRQFEKNNMTANDVPAFLDWTFGKAEERKLSMHTGLLRTFANEYVIKDIHRIKRNRKFRETIDGEKYLKKGE